MTHSEPMSVYVHVPFCRHRCGYCDFTLVAERDDLIDAYLAALETELQSASSQRVVKTLFFGGGTPTHLSVEQLVRLFTVVARHFTVSDDGEVSIEANPDGLSDDKIEVLREHGVNRISLGVQSFDDVVLSTLERTHTAEVAADVVERLRSSIANISLDLIFGVPGQTLDSWQNTLSRAIGLQPQHISTYGLTYETGTQFYSRRERGDLVPLHSEIERAMYLTAMQSLGQAGFEHYEISNFAMPGCRCRHNETYWAAESYFAFGPGAARYVDGRRETNVRSVFGWLKRIEAGEDPTGEREQLSVEDRAREAIVLALRTSCGISRREFAAQFEFRAEELSAAAIEKHAGLGNLVDDGDTFRLSDQGRFVADAVVVDFL